MSFARRPRNNRGFRRPWNTRGRGSGARRDRARSRIVISERHLRLRRTLPVRTKGGALYKRKPWLMA